MKSRGARKVTVAGGGFAKVHPDIRSARCYDCGSESPQPYVDGYRLRVQAVHRPILICGRCWSAMQTRARVALGAKRRR